MWISVFIFGLFLGSFLNLVADRLINGGPIFVGRSECASCKMPLSAKNLIPLLSFIFQKGKCANCGVKLSYYHPFSEVATGLALVFAAYRSGFLLDPTSTASILGFLFLGIVLSLYIILFLTDIKYQLIPDIIVYLAIAFVFVFLVSSQFFSLNTLRQELAADDFGKYLIQAGYLNNQITYALRSLGYTLFSAILLAAFFQFLIFVTKGKGMGGGDVKLAFLIGLFNGFPNNILAIFLGFIFGALFSLVLLARKSKGMKDTIAFGPFLILGSLVAYAWGTQFLDWYFSISGF